MYETDKDSLCIMRISVFSFGTPYFKSKDLAKQAIEILGEETVKLALSQV